MTDALVKYEPTGPQLPTATEIAVLRDVAAAMAASQMGFMPDAFNQKPQACMALCLTAHAYGVHPMLAAQHAYVIKGKVSFEVAFKIGVAKSRVPGLDLEVIDWSDERCVVKGTRPGRTPVTVEFTYAQAEKAGLTKKEVWQMYRQDMLYNRAAGRVVKMLCPDALLGLPVFDDDRERGDAPPEPEAAPAPAEAKPTAEPSSAEVVDEPDYREMALALFAERGYNRKHAPSVKKIMERVLSDESGPFVVSEGGVMAADWQRFYERMQADPAIRKETEEKQPQPPAEVVQGGHSGRGTDPVPAPTPDPREQEPDPEPEIEEVPDEPPPLFEDLPSTLEHDSTPEGFVELCQDAEKRLGGAILLREGTPGRWWFVSLKTLIDCNLGGQAIAIHKAEPGVLGMLALNVRQRVTLIESERMK